MVISWGFIWREVGLLKKVILVHKFLKLDNLIFLGNNFVSVVFNESGQPYRLGTVSGQFDTVALEVIF